MVHWGNPTENSERGVGYLREGKKLCSILLVAQNHGLYLLITCNRGNEGVKYKNSTLADIFMLGCLRHTRLFVQ